jgi:hypothetical protein
MSIRILFFIGFLLSIALAQDLMPLRFTALQDAKLEYRSVDRVQIVLAFSYAKSLDGKLIPFDLKAAFETSNENQLRQDSARSTLQVLKVQDDGTRIVALKVQSDLKILAPLEKFYSTYTLEYQPDGRINLSDYYVEIRQPGMNQSIREQLPKLYEIGTRTSMLIIEQCYGQFKSNESKALMLDPSRLIPAPDPTEPPRQIGEIRLEQDADGKTICHFGVDSKQYPDPKETKQFRNIRRGTLQFLPDGTLEHSEWIGSTSLTPENKEFEFKGKKYRVFFVQKFLNSSSTDRLN